MSTSVALAFVRREVVLASGVAVAAVETAVASGTPLQVALQAAAPLVLSAVVRSLVSPSTPTKENTMADLTALKKSVADLSTAVTSAEAYVNSLKSEQATEQTDVDALTAQVEQLTAQVPVAPAAPVA